MQGQSDWTQAKSARHRVVARAQPQLATAVSQLEWRGGAVAPYIGWQWAGRAGKCDALASPRRHPARSGAGWMLPPLLVSLWQSRISRAIRARRRYGERWFQNLRTVPELTHCAEFSRIPTPRKITTIVVTLPHSHCGGTGSARCELSPAHALGTSAGAVTICWPARRSLRPSWPS